MRTCDGRHPHAGRSRARPVSSPTLMSIIAVCSSLLAGCSESVEAPLEVEPQRAVVTTDREIQEIQDLFLGERDFVEIAATEPAFAGYYVEDQTLVAAVSGMTRETAVRGLVESRVPDLQRTAEGQFNSAIEVRAVAYSFHQLSRWRNLAFRCVCQGYCDPNSITYGSKCDQTKDA